MTPFPQVQETRFTLKIWFIGIGALPTTLAPDGVYHFQAVIPVEFKISNFIEMASLAPARESGEMTIPSDFPTPHLQEKAPLVILLASVFKTKESGKSVVPIPDAVPASSVTTIDGLPINAPSKFILRNPPAALVLASTLMIKEKTFDPVWTMYICNSPGTGATRAAKVLPEVKADSTE